MLVGGVEVVLRRRQILVRLVALLGQLLTLLVRHRLEILLVLIGLPPAIPEGGRRGDQQHDAGGYEIKWDGYRAIAFVDDGHVRFQSTNLLDLTPRWPEVSGLPRDVHASSAVLDGEMVALAPDGAPRFELLQRGDVPVTY